ncbi:uncharacterized protein LOC116022939 isoform X2 [Ipomoea triloba]|uniref:uncharacterized protein LOC116022939 isoform X2 n=1 Tax=Ipomoea triloba TaxID=35885 RepID=UPI00125D3C3B|nr:uncharacterized protein LOC116022939 isoform X2 [Ipomoea triloba]
MGEHEGVNSVAASETEPASGETLMGNLEQGGDESDIMVEVKGSDVFVDGDCLKKVDSESKTEDLDGGVDLGAKEVQEGKTETGVEDLQDVAGAARDVDEMECAEAVSERTDVAEAARDVVEMECAEAVSEQTVVVEEVGDEDTEKGVEGVELSSTGVESDVSVSNPGNEPANEPESKSSENEPVTENAASIPKEDSSSKDDVIPGEETSTKDETRHDSVTDAGVSSSENEQGLVNSTLCEGVDKDRPAESENSQSQLAREDDPLMPREEETTGFKDEAMRDPVANVGVSSSENDQGLVNRTVFNKADTDCSGHDNNKISDCPSEPRSSPSEIVREDATLMPGEEDTNFKDKDTHIEDAGLSSLENDQSLATPATCPVIDKDSSGHATDKILDSPVEAATERETGEVNKDEILHSKAESMENIVDHKNSPHNEEGLQVDGEKCTAICDMVVAGSQSPDERADASDGCGAREVDSKGSDNPNCGVLDESESDKIIQTEAPKSADNDVKDNSEVLPDQQPSTESGTNNINGEESELSHAKCNNLEKGDAMEVEVEGVLDSENRTSIHYSENDITLETSNNTVCPADVNEDKLDVTNATNLGPAKDSDVVQTDAMDIDEDKLGFVNATNLGSPKDSDIVQTDSELSVKNTVVVPANTQVIDSNTVAKSELEGLGGHESAPKDDENVGLVNKGNQAGNDCATDTEMIDDNSTFEFIDDGFWQEDEGKNTIPRGDNARSEGTPDMGSVQSHGQIGTEESLVECQGNVVQSDATPGTDTEICNQMSSQSTCISNEEVVMQQNLVLTPEADHGQSTVMTTVAEEQVEGATGSGAYNEVIGQQAIEMENADGFLDAHVPETTVVDEQREEENEKLHSDEKHDIGEQREIQENASQIDQSLVSGVKATKPANFANIYPGFLLPPEKLGKFTVSDLVWGKVRSHPWWPGQIFDPADASEKAVRYYKKGCFLVAYFGDRTFAWNDATVLKPFWSHFSQIEKQSNSETFQNAVRGALDEVSRRIELGLACSCIPKSSYNKIACQVVENTGIREESSRRYGVDKSTGVKSFTPDKVLLFLRGVARSPTCGADQLDLVIARAQLLAYSRFKGCSELSEFLSGGELLENDEEGVTVNKGPSHKRKHNLKDSLQPTKKERRMSEIMGNSELDETLADGSDRTKSVYSAKVSSTTSVTPNPPPFKIGERILRAASHLKGDSTQPEASSPLQNPPKEKVAGPSELPSIDELFSQLQLVAQAPMGDYSFLNTFIHCILDLRYPKHSELQNSSTGRPVVGRKRRASQAPDGAAEDFEFDDINDSYWTDRIVQNYSEEQLLQNGENGGREEFPVSPFDSEKVHKATRRSYSRKRYSIGNNEIGVDECNEEAEKRKLEPAELILNFAEGNRLPTEMSLNKTFRRFGPIKELETEVHPDCARARVVFKRGSDAEVAYSSAGKFNIFGSMQVNYELNYTPVISVRPLLLTIPQGQEEAI